MSAKFFKNSRCAKRLLPEVFLCIQAVDKMLKPSYLWDAFTAEVAEIRSYLEELYLHRLTDHELKVLLIDDTIFVTLYDSLKRHLDSFSFSSIDLINVSKTVSVPALLTMEEKKSILEPIIKCSREILTHLQSKDTNHMKSIDYALCNPSTLFGVLLGYPVLYWFSYQSPHSEFACLSMLPLKVHKIVTNISLPSNYPKMYLNSKNMPMCHELFNFSIPENVSKQTDYLVQSWFRMLICKSKSISMFYGLQIKTNIISLPSVSM